MNAFMTLFLKGYNIMLTESWFYLDEFGLFSHSCGATIQIQHFSKVSDSLGHSRIQLIQSALNVNYEILRFVILLIVQCTERMTEKWPFFRYFLINYFGKGIMGLKELLKYLIWITCKPVTPLQLPLGK